MSTIELKSLDFFDLKLLDNKEGIFYVRDGKIFIYYGNSKLNIDADHPDTADPFELRSALEDNLPGCEPDTFKFGNTTAKRLDPTKDVKAKGIFCFWQHDEYFILNFVTENNRHHKGTVYLLRAGKATDSL